MKEDQKNKSKPYRKGMTVRIRVAARRLNGPEGFSRSDVFNHAEVLVSEMPSFNPCWLELRARGELERLGYKKYRYNEDLAPQGGGVKKKTYRAMHVKGAFCSADIAKLSEADISYVNEIIRGLVKSEWLELTGKKWQVKFFRVRNSEKFYLEHVRGIEGKKVGR